CLTFFFQAEDGIRDPLVTGVQTCALPIFFGFAAFGGGGGKFQFAFLELDADGAGALVGELGYAGDGGAKVFAVYGDALAVVFGRSEERRVGKECRSRRRTNAVNEYE